MIIELNVPIWELFWFLSFFIQAFEGGYPSENDNIPSQRGVSEHTAEEPTSSAQPETVPGNIAIMKEQMKSENLHKKSKTSGTVLLTF